MLKLHRKKSNFTTFSIFFRKVKILQDTRQNREDSSKLNYFIGKKFCGFFFFIYHLNQRFS